MTEITKRFSTSILLLIILILSIYSHIILAFFLIISFYQMTYEFYFMFNKALTKKNKIIYMFMSLIIIINCYLVLFVWNALYSNNPELKLIFFLIICITISTDIGGYVFGKLLNGKKLSKISPNKTYSGMFGSYILSIIIVFYLFNDYFNLINLLIYTLIVSTSSQIGDLSISYLKRSAQLKDTSNILPGHGGLLDRFDGLILAIPFGSILFKIL